MRKCLTHIFRALSCNRHALLLSTVASILLILMCYGTLFFRGALLYAERNHLVAVNKQIDPLDYALTDNKVAISQLREVVQDLRDRVNRLEGMLIGFGGCATLLQLFNTVIQYKRTKGNES